MGGAEIVHRYIYISRVYFQPRSGWFTTTATRTEFEPYRPRDSSRIGAEHTDEASEGFYLPLEWHREPPFSIRGYKFSVVSVSLTRLGGFQSVSNSLRSVPQKCEVSENVCSVQFICRLVFVCQSCLSLGSRFVHLFVPYVGWFAAALRLAV